MGNEGDHSLMELLATLTLCFGFYVICRWLLGIGQRWMRYCAKRWSAND